MRPIHLADLHGSRPVLVLTRETVRPNRTRITIAPITTRVRGLQTELAVGPANGLDSGCVVNCDNIETLAAELLGRRVGALLPEQEEALTAAIHAAFDLAE